jgi:hypothetical protein
MRPESTSVTLRRDLSATAQEFDTSTAANKFIGRKAAPIFQTPEASETYPVMKRENFKKPAETARAEGGAFNRIVGEFGKGTFSCDEHGLEYPIDDRRRKRYATFIDAEQAATRILWYQMRMAHERRVAALYSGAGLTNTNVVTAWSTVASADPANDVIIAANKLADACGCDISELSLVIPRADLLEALRTDAIVEQVKYTYPGIRPAQLSAAQFAAIIGIKQVLPATGAYDSAIEGETESNSQIWTAGIMYLALLAEDNDPLEVPSAFRTMLWTASAPELPVVETYREEKVAADIVRMRDDTDEVATAEVDLMAQKITNT